MKQLTAVLLAGTMLFVQCKAQNQQQLLPDYNSSYYPSVLQSAEGVAMPFLLQQQYKTMPGVTVQNDSFLVYNGKTYAVHAHYVNPNAQFNNGYYVSAANYKAFNIPAATVNIWPYRIPYALYNSQTNTFNATIDCVGYGTRLLSATGSANASDNAYMQLAAYIHGQNMTPFAARGYVASAYEIAAAFPTLPPSAQHGWQYVAGNVNTHIIDSLNQNNPTHKGMQHYTGAGKGGFAQAQPGDILAFGYAPGGESNGHFMVVEQSPVLLDAQSIQPYFAPYQQQLSGRIDSLLQAYNIYALPLYDCSGENIHFNDSRKYMSGIGHGTLLVLTDKAGDIPQGFIFSPPHAKNPIVGAEFMSAHVVAITVGRYVN